MLEAELKGFNSSSYLSKLFFRISAVSEMRKLELPPSGLVQCAVNTELSHEGELEAVA